MYDPTWGDSACWCSESFSSLLASTPSLPFSPLGDSSVVAQMPAPLFYPDLYGLEPTSPFHATIVTSFRKEVSLLGKLTHPNVVRLLGVTVLNNGQPQWMVMERCSCSLATWRKLRPKGSLPLRQLLSFVRDLFAGLVYVDVSRVLRIAVWPVDFAGAGPCSFHNEVSGGCDVV